MSNPGSLTRSTIPRILLVVSSYAPNVGGLQVVTGNLARELRRRGYRVAILTTRYPRTLLAVEEIDGVRVRRLMFLTPRMRDLQNGRADLFFASLYYFPSTLLRLIWQLAREKPDVVNLHFAGAPTLFVLIARRLRRFRLIVSLHGDDVEGLPRGTRFDKWLLRAILRRADVVTACSCNLLDQAAAVEPGVRTKGWTIHNGVELPAVAQTAGDDSIVALGRMVHKKGFDVLLRAVPQARIKHLRIIGDGPERAALESLAASLGLDGQIEFCGRLDRAELLKAVAASRLVVIPSRQEPFGIVALEAMGMGKPVVATSVGGLPEVLQDADARLVAPDDPAGLAEAISFVTARLRGEPHYGARNRDLAARFSVERMVDQYASLYHQQASPADPPAGMSGS